MDRNNNVVIAGGGGGERVYRVENGGGEKSKGK